MKLIIFVILIASSCAHIHSATDELDGHDNSYHKDISARDTVEHKEIFKTKTDTTDPEEEDEEGDVDPVNVAIEADTEPEEVDDDDECEATTTDDVEKEADEESGTNRKQSDEDHQKEEKVGKRSVAYGAGPDESAAVDNQYRLRAKRSSSEGEEQRWRRSVEEEDEGEEEGAEHDEDDDHSKRKRRDMEFDTESHLKGEHRRSGKRSIPSDSEEDEHEGVIRKRNADDPENLPNPTFASDDVQQVNSPFE